MSAHHADATATMTMHTGNVAKELAFEDMSVHSPGLFRKGDAMRALRENPSSGTFRRALAELDQTADSFRRILDNAQEKALGNSEADLERIKTNVKRLKFGTIELSTEQAFLRSILESRPLPSQAPSESDEFKARSVELKKLKDANDAAERVVEAAVREVGESATAFAAEHAALTARIERLDALEAEVEAAELAAAGADAVAAPDPGDASMPDEEVMANVEALDAEIRAVNAALRTREGEAAALKTALDPGEAVLAAVKAEAKVLAGAGRAARRGAAAAAEVAETDAVIREQRALVERLTGVEVLHAGCPPGAEEPHARELVLRVRTHVPSCPAAALEPVDDAPFPATRRPAPPSEKTHVMTVRFHPGSAAVREVRLEPPGVPIDDIAATAAAAGSAEEALATLVAETRVRVAAAENRAEALACTAAQVPMEWSREQSQARVGLYNGQGGVAALDVPMEWPLNGARVRVVGLAGLAPATVAAAAQRVEPGGYVSGAAALRATQEALAAEGHRP